MSSSLSRSSSSGGAAPPPARSSSVTSYTSPSSPRRSTSSGGGNGSSSKLADNMVKSMTIDEMRFLHQRAISEAEAKRTELRLVLASRYRELVGSSDEVIKMKERAQELQDLVQALPGLIEKLSTSHEETKEVENQETHEKTDNATLRLRRDLSLLPRVIHRALDKKDVYTATVSLIRLFTLITSQTDAYPLANRLSTGPVNKAAPDLDPAVDAQMRMTFLHLQTLPDKIARISNRILSRTAVGAEESAAALAALDLLGATVAGAADKSTDRSEALLSTYFDSKAALLGKLLSKLNESTNAEEILSKIVWILQHDVIVHAFQIFVQRNVDNEIMKSLPLFDTGIVKIKCSKFLSQHLPLIRTKVKSVLVTIAGTTASALGQIRQSLYDKTDGAESMERLNCWDDAVGSLVDIRTVLNSADADAKNRFSLWGALFSHTFSSLVHSLLTTSFQSVHTQVISTLRASLANAPPVEAILPHEAYRNTLKIATELDQSLLKVSDDAHELLVHAEEREESERRLRQSLYVQTCEIMGRLICELRRMVHRADDDPSDATMELIVGRLCFLLKFRLTSLRTLLCSDSSPASMHTTSGMISYVDLQSAFELADDNEDGLITFDEAVEAVESAFSGTPFQGAEMVRETLLLEGKEAGGQLSGGGSDTPTNVTLNELTLLTARGLRHNKTGAASALGTIQMSLDSIVAECFQKWAKYTLSSSSKSLETSLRDFLLSASSIPDEEWRRIFLGTSTDPCKGVSPHVVGFLLDVASNLNRNVCPSDSLTPVPNFDYASALGIITSKEGSLVPTLMETMRWALLTESYGLLASLFEGAVTSESGSDLERSCSLGLIQLHVDVLFVKLCFTERNQCGFGSFSGSATRTATAAESLEKVMQYTDRLLKGTCDPTTLASLPNLTAQKHQRVLQASDLFFSSLFGDDKEALASSAGELMDSAEEGDALFHVPLASSRRFVLLPVQADRSLSDIQIRGKYAKEKEEVISERRETTSGNVISGGLGFLSSMLKTKK